MLVLIDCSHLLFYIFTFITGGMLLLYNQIWIWERFLQSIKEENSSAAACSNKNICEAYYASGLVLSKRTKLPQHFTNIFF